MYLPFVVYCIKIKKILNVYGILKDMLIYKYSKHLQLKSARTNSKTMSQIFYYCSFVKLNECCKLKNEKMINPLIFIPL